MCCKLEKPIDHTQGRGPTFPAVRVHPGRGAPPTPTPGLCQPGVLQALAQALSAHRRKRAQNVPQPGPPQMPPPCRRGNSDRPRLLQRSKFAFPSFLPARPSRQTICCHFPGCSFVRKPFSLRPSLAASTEAEVKTCSNDLEAPPPPPPCSHRRCSLRPAPRKRTRSTTTNSSRRQPRSCAAPRTQLGRYMSRPSTLPFSASRSLLQRLLLSKDGPKD
jgi:hypothetical protein